MTAILQITDGLSTTVLLNLNAGIAGGSAAQAGLALARGELKQAGISENVDWSPASLASPDRRQITLPFVLIGSSADDVGAKVSALMLLTKSPWHLRVRRHNASQDSWLRCYACVPDVATDITSSSFAHIAVGQITAETEPYALGARVDVGPATITQDPSNSAAWGWDIASVAGDAPTPMLLKLADTTMHGQAHTTWVSVRTRNTPSNLTATAITRQMAASQVSSAAANVTVTDNADSLMSGGSSLRLNASASYAANALTGIAVPGPTLSGPDGPGTYRLLCRIRRNVNQASTPMFIQARANESSVSPEEVQIPTSAVSDTRVVGRGVGQAPSGINLQMRSPIGAPSASPGAVTLYVWKGAGAGILDLDWLAWVPADESGGYLSTAAALPSTSWWLIVDGFSDTVSVTSADPTAGSYNLMSQVFGSGANPQWTGGAPRLTPGANRVFVVSGLSGAANWPQTQSITIAGSYWPRFTWLR